MAIKLIVFDVDGTVVDEDHYTVPEENAAALKEARSRGIKLAIASGRTWSILTEVAEQVGGVDYAIMSNGAAILDVNTGERLFEKGIPPAQSLAVMEVLDREDLPYEMYCGGQNYVALEMKDRLRDGLLSPAFGDMFVKRMTVVPDLREALNGRDMEKINLFYAPVEARARIREALLKTGPLEISNALEGNMEFTYGGVCKGTTLERLARCLGISADEVMAFGDAGNDVEMLRWAGWSFAMENGSEAAKAAARAIAPPNYLGGVGRTVRKYVLEQE